MGQHSTLAPAPAFAHILQTMQVAQHRIDIAAPAQRVWDVLTLTRFIRQWDDVPADYLADRIESGAAFTWSGHATVTYTTVEPPRRLYGSLRVQAWTQPPSGPVGYEYVITPTANGCQLEITVGDFAHVPDGAPFLEASQEFVVTAAETIKRLAEGDAS